MLDTAEYVQVKRDGEFVSSLSYLPFYLSIDKHACMYVFCGAIIM